MFTTLFTVLSFIIAISHVFCLQKHLQICLQLFCLIYLFTVFRLFCCVLKATILAYWSQFFPLLCYICLFTARFPLVILQDTHFVIQNATLLGSSLIPLSYTNTQHLHIKNTARIYTVPGSNCLSYIKNYNVIFIAKIEF